MEQGNKKIPVKLYYNYKTLSVFYHCGRTGWRLLGLDVDPSVRCISQLSSPVSIIIHQCPVWIPAQPATPARNRNLAVKHRCSEISRPVRLICLDQLGISGETRSWTQLDSGVWAFYKIRSQLPTFVIQGIAEQSSAIQKLFFVSAITDMNLSGFIRSLCNVFIQ